VQRPLLVAPALIWAAQAAAAPGELDPAFGNGGIVRTSFAEGDDGARDVAVHPDGHIVVVGQATVGGQRDFAVARYLPHGTVDHSFGGDGKMTTETLAGANFEDARAVALQPDGKIVVAGYADQFTVVRYNADGTLDDTFSDDGVQTVEIGDGHSIAHDVAVDTRGRIVLVGTAKSPLPTSNDDAAFAGYCPTAVPIRASAATV
jgi:uncharacterized delta-60 repeat protein